MGGTGGRTVHRRGLPLGEEESFPLRTVAPVGCTRDGCQRASSRRRRAYRPASLPWIAPMRLAWLLLCMPCAASAAPLLRSEGVATLANGVIAYREVHWQRGAGDGSERWVEYLCPAGQPFARKQMPAATRPQVRGYVLQDARSGQAADVRVDPGVVRVDWKEDTSTPSRTRQLPLPPDAVIDAGFDAAVRAHWRTLQGGAPVSLPFLVPGRQRFYPVQVQYQGPVRWQGLSAHAVNVRLDTWFGAVAPRLSLVYA